MGSGEGVGSGEWGVGSGEEGGGSGKGERGERESFVKKSTNLA